MQNTSIQHRPNMPTYIAALRIQLASLELNPSTPERSSGPPIAITSTGSTMSVSGALA